MGNRNSDPKVKLSGKNEFKYVDVLSLVEYIINKKLESCLIDRFHLMLHQYSDFNNRY